jgi:uncharacterized protein
MRTHSPLIVDVRELLESPGSQRSLSLRAPVADLRTGIAAVRDDLSFDLTLEAVDGGILVQGTISGEFVESCRRCLKEVITPFEVAVAEIYRPPGAVWEEGYVVNHDSIDLERAARDGVGLELPMSPLCRPDCAGLCPRCGADLNEGPCDCPPEPADPRWSALRDLGR